MPGILTLRQFQSGHLSRARLSFFEAIALLTLLDGTPFPERGEPIWSFLELVFDVFSQNGKEFESVATISVSWSVNHNHWCTYEPPVQMKSESEYPGT